MNFSVVAETTIALIWQRGWGLFIFKRVIAHLFNHVLGKLSKVINHGKKD